MSDNKLFLEELKYLVENELSLNEYMIDQLEERFNKNPFLIIQIHQTLVKYKTLLPFLNDIESVVYDYIVNTEMLNDKTYYGATLFVAELFDTTQTYIKCKVSQTDKMLKKIS